jgi:hypothetical protein
MVMRRAQIPIVVEILEAFERIIRFTSLKFALRSKRLRRRNTNV